jgi:hypothetical protein
MKAVDSVSVPFAADAFTNYLHNAECTTWTSDVARRPTTIGDGLDARIVLIKTVLNERFVSEIATCTRQLAGDTK